MKNLEYEIEPLPRLSWNLNKLIRKISRIGGRIFIKLVWTFFKVIWSDPRLVRHVGPGRPPEIVERMPAKGPLYL